MKVRVRYFAILKEKLGLDEEELTIEAESVTVAEVFDRCVTRRNESLGARRSHLRAALNHEFVSFEANVADGDELAFIPPVSGGSDTRYMVTKAPLNAREVRELVARDHAGAICIFEGVVRDHTGDREVQYLEYEAYKEMAHQKLVETGNRALDRWPEVLVAVHHRYGRLEIGEVAVVIAVSSPHRKDAFEACQWVIDTLKEEVPIWKKEVSPGGDSWIGWGP